MKEVKNMYIVENECLEEIRKIWIENNSGYIGNNCNLRSINDNNMLKVVCKTDADVCGYAVLYFEKDFCELEKYPNYIENMSKKTIYMWEMVTSKNHLKEGVASKIYDYIKTKFNDYTIYAAIDEKNIPSLNLHIKEKFIPIYNFYKEDENVNYIMHEWSNAKGE